MIQADPAATGLTGDAFPARRIALRRDGARPLCFQGARLMSSALDDPQTGARFALELYVASDGRPVARLAVEPPEDSGGSSLNVAEHVLGPDDLDALIDRLDPAQALPLPLDPAHGDDGAAAQALRRAYRRFADAVRRAAPQPGPQPAPHPAQQAAPPPRAATPTPSPVPPATLTQPPAPQGAPHARPIAPRPPAAATSRTATQTEDATMNPMQQYAEPSDSPSKPEGGSGGMAMSFSIKRVGAKPLSFHGSELAMAMNFSPKAPSWYEINIYRTAEQHFIAAVKLFYASADEQDVAHAWEFDDFGAVITHLEAYDPADDVRVDVQPDDPTLSLPEMAAHALALRARAAEARRQYRALLGEILHELDAA